MGLVFPFLTTSEMYEFLPEPVLIMAEYSQAEVTFLGQLILMSCRWNGYTYRKPPLFPGNVILDKNYEKGKEEKRINVKEKEDRGKARKNSSKMVKLSSKGTKIRV
jgi:hypothetical protein